MVLDVFIKVCTIHFHFCPLGHNTISGLSPSKTILRMPGLSIHASDFTVKVWKSECSQLAIQHCFWQHVVLMSGVARAVVVVVAVIEVTLCIIHLFCIALRLMLQVDMDAMCALLSTICGQVNLLKRGFTPPPLLSAVVLLYANH